MVPMAPSSTRMRSRANASKAVRWAETVTVILSRSFLCAGGANAQQVADREHQVGAVHGVEVEGVDAVLGEFLSLAGRDGGGQELARVRIVVQPVEFFREPCGYGGAGAGREVAGLVEIVHRHDAGHDRKRNAARAPPVEVAKIKIVV